MNTLLPIISANGNLMDQETGELARIKYLAGYPRQYRFDANKGLFNLNGDVNITKKGEPLAFIPIAYRIFSDNILGMGRKKWVEFFFLNEALQLCAVLFHQYSVENFMKVVANEMFYDAVSPCQVCLTAKPVEKVSKAQGNKYFIAEFAYKLLDTTELEKLQLVTKDLTMWREETTTGDADIQFSLNWNPPIKREELPPVTEPTPPDKKEQ